MTECTGKRYWRNQIAACRERYIVRCSGRKPGVPLSGIATEKDCQAFHMWYLARINYLNNERDKLYAANRRSRTSLLNGTARDIRAGARGKRV